MPEEEEEGEIEGEKCHELRVRRGHAVTLAIHFWRPSALKWQGTNREQKTVRGGLSSLINLLSKKFRTSHPIWPANMRKISTSLDAHINVT
jgi:hypothetical protein